jgi:hypothetical protein
MFEPNHNVLLVTTCILFIPLAFYAKQWFYRKEYILPAKQIRLQFLYESCLAAILFAVIVSSLLFWRNPEQNGFIHTIDGILVKVAIAVFLVYVLFYKERWRDIVCMTAILLLFVFAAMSHYFSSKKWCSPEHLFFHGGLHFACSLSSAYAFI